MSVYYKTKDGAEFNNEQEGQDHANGLGYMDKGIEAGQRGDYDEAISYYDEAIPLLSYGGTTHGRCKGIAYFYRGLNHYRKGNYDKAIEDCDSAFIYPGMDYKNKANAYNIRGVAYDKKGNKEQAIADWKKAVDTDSTGQGGENALANLANNGIQYTPQKPQSSYSSSSDSSSSYDYSDDDYSDSSYSDDSIGTKLLGILFGILGAVALLAIALVVLTKLNANGLVNLAGLLVGPALGYTLGWNMSRSSAGKLIVIATLIGAGILFVWFNWSAIVPYFDKAQTVSATATTSQNVNFRDKPSTDSNIIRQIPQGETITITGKAADGWTPIKHGKDSGWISSEFVKQ